MKRVQLADLPAELRAAIGDRTFLYAFALEDGRFVARDVVRGANARELEWNGRVLEQHERALPAEARTRVEDMSVVSTHYCEDETILRVVIEIEGIAKVDKQVYDYTLWTLDDVVKEAVARARFPEEYARWPRDAQVHYWARMIHRFRRVNGEDGREEDDVYTLGLVEEMRAVDPRIEDLLADIIGLVGRMEQTAPAEAIAAFTAKTGIRLS